MWYGENEMLCSRELGEVQTLSLSTLLTLTHAAACMCLCNLTRRVARKVTESDRSLFATPPGLHSFSVLAPLSKPHLHTNCLRVLRQHRMSPSSSDKKENVVHDDQGNGFEFAGFFSTIKQTFGGDAHQECRTAIEQCQEKCRLAEEKVGECHIAMVAQKAQHAKDISAYNRKDWIDGGDRVKRAVAINTEELKKEHKSELAALRQKVMQSLEKEQKEAREAFREKCDKKLHHREREVEKDNEKTINERVQQARREHEEELNRRLQAMKKEHDTRELAHVAKYNALEEKLHKLHKTAQPPAIQVEPLTDKLHVRSDNTAETTLQLRKEIAALKKDVSMMQAAKFKDVEVGHWMLDPATVTGELDGIFRDIKQWAERHATFSFKQVMDNFYCISPKLLVEGCISSEDALRDALMSEAKLFKPGKAATHLLTALVSTLLSKSMLGHPFFAFAATDNSRRLQKRDGIVLQQIVDKVMKSESHNAPIEGLKVVICIR